MQNLLQKNPLSVSHVSSNMQVLTVRSNTVLLLGECIILLEFNATYFNGEVFIPQENML